MWKFYKHKKYICFNFNNFEFRNFENMFVVTFRVNQGLGWFLSKRGDEVSMCDFKEVDILLKSIFCWYKGVLK